MAEQQEAQHESSQTTEDGSDDEQPAIQDWIHDRLQASALHEQLAGEFVKGTLELGTGCAVGAVLVVPILFIATGTAPSVEVFGAGIVPLGIAAYHERIACRLGDGSDDD